MNVLPVRMNNKQHASATGFHSDCADRLPPLLSRFAVGAVEIDQAMFVLKLSFVIRR
jgi:hypothetical protein